MPTARAISVLAIAALATTTGLVSAQAATTPPAAPARSHPTPATRSGHSSVSIPVRQLAHLTKLLHTERPGLGAAVNQTSTNWSGYAATSGGYTAVSSSWTEPSVSSCTSNGIVAFWIGLDGWGSGTVEQDGTGVDCSSGSPEQFAWWETYPENDIQEYGNYVAGGDSMTSTVTYEGGDEYDMVLTDDTQGWTENNPVAGPSGAQNASAEVIAEAVTANGSVTELPDFGQVDFTGSTIDGDSLQEQGAQPIDMVDDGGDVIASTGTADSNGDFSVAYTGN
jgi:Peptidase A4 family